ncbi:MAG TPA: hypothetical protein VF796_17410 [Humisphaera sp.]
MTDRAYVATRKGLFTVGHENGRWAVVAASFVGDNVTLVFPDRRTGALYAALDHGHFGCKVHRSDDGGATWREVGCPKYPERPADLPPEVDPFGRAIPWNLKLIWALEAGAAPGELWCGTIPGGLFRSTDGGDTWHMNRPLWDMPDRKRWMGGGADQPGLHSLCLDPRDGRTLYAGVSCGGVWKTTDGGDTWAVASQGMRADYMPPGKQTDPVEQDPHRIVQCPAAPDVFWCQHHNGIFRSTDGSRTWTEVTAERPGKSGFAVCVHPHDPETAWFVPMLSDEKRIPPDGRLVVLKTTDGGRSFAQQRAGLPQRHAYDLVFRHAMDVDGTGGRLAFGSTTGHVYVTEDGGERWEDLAERLPPVYAVRWG